MKYGIPGPWRELLAVLLAPLLAIALASALHGCDETTTPHEVRAQANAMRREVNAASEHVATARTAVVLACNWRGKSSPECVSLTMAYHAAESGIAVAHELIDVYDDTGLGLAAADHAASEARKLADDLARDVRGVTEALHELGLDARAAGEALGDGDRPSGAPAAPAEGTEALPAAAGPAQ